MLAGEPAVQEAATVGADGGLLAGGIAKEQDPLLPPPEPLQLQR